MSSSTSSSVNSMENNDDTPAMPYEVQKRDVLCSNSTRYLVMNFNGEGCFGKVATCVDLTTGNHVAVKIHKTEKCFIRKEVKMLEAIRTLDAEKNNIVQFLEYFKFNSLSCMAFEKLDRSLWDLMEERSWVPLSLNEIRPVVYQLMVAFDALKGIGILHTDVKLDNIMLINHKDQPFKIKLIDFGLARQVSKVREGEMMQPNGCRAPEVSLGLPISEAIDMWGVGCVMAFLFFGDHLFPGNCLYNSMRSMVHLLGQPADHMLNAAQYTWAYFCYDPSIPGWRLNSPHEYKEATGVQADVEYTTFDWAENLDDAVKTFTPIRDNIAYEDRMAFLSLLKACLDLDPRRRVTPREAFKNTFLSMGHLADVMDCMYADEALHFMTVSPLNHLSESDYFLSDTDMDLSEMTHSNYGKSDCQAIDADLETEPSPATPSERLTENSIAEDANMENNYDDDFNEHWRSENEGRFPDIESCSCVDSHTDSYGADIKNKSEKSFDIESSIEGEPHTSGNYSDVECSFDDGHVQLTRTRCFANLCFPEGDDIGTVSIYPNSFPSSSDRRSPGFCGDDFPSEISSNGYSEGEIFILDVSSAAPASATINPVTNCGPIASVDEASGAVGPPVGAAGNPSNPGVEKKKKTLLQRIRKFFSKFKASVV
ncbi:Homeodomain-interacting protein kinase 3 [Nibea albiflora]|uniref:Homeodomain-interacting protein kinase 3 n=1 Tax=Nibea albiflora TaxID=240163 RepID=A0ACB7EGY3_NIBAL|nr:Homeodomain-interacting protein kinase 3 [Nibea albiflora]